MGRKLHGWMKTFLNIVPDTVYFLVDNCFLEEVLMLNNASSHCTALFSDNTIITKLLCISRVIDTIQATVMPA
jgi:hypothetical protein